jgi:hypothetical protein
MCIRMWGTECSWGPVGARYGFGWLQKDHGLASMATDGLRIASDRACDIMAEFRQGPDWTLTSPWRPEMSLAWLLH